MFREIINFYENKGCQALLITELEATVPLDVGLINETLTASPGKKKSEFFFFNQTHCSGFFQEFAISQHLLTETIYHTHLIIQFFFFLRDACWKHKRDKKVVFIKRKPINVKTHLK